MYIINHAFLWHFIKFHWLMLPRPQRLAGRTPASTPPAIYILSMIAAIQKDQPEKDVFPKDESYQSSDSYELPFNNNL